jgi:hypothetical protein
MEHAGGLSIVVSFGTWKEEETRVNSDGSGRLFRRGFAVAWERPLDPKIVFFLKFQMRLNDVEVEQSFSIRELL